MFANREGQRVPDITFRLRRDGAWYERTSQEIFGGRNVVVFALPGAFTPTCSSAHVPRYDELAADFRARGIDEIVCVSVNDAFVMDAWQADQRAENLTFLPDGNGELTDAMGLLVDKSNIGFGPRSWRYSMLVRDGVIEKMFIEADVEGDPFDVSDADTMLAHLGAAAEKRHDIALISRAGCGHCVRARRMLDELGLTYDEVEASPRRLRAFAGATSTPQVFVDGKSIGGADELAAWLAASKPT